MKSPADQHMLMNNPLENENQLLGMVEGFFDFSNKEEEEDGVVEDVAAPEAEAEAEAEAETETEAGKSFDSTTPTTRVSSALDFSSNSSGSGSAAGNGDLCHSDELLFLLDELPDTTDWIANIVDESYSTEDIENFQLISGVKSSSSSLTTANTTNSDVSEKPITAKARSKRPRMAPLNWASRIVQRPPTTTETSSIVTSSELSSVIPTPVMKSAKAAKKETITTTTTTAVPLGPLGPDGRRCLHCDAQNTPQWRTGPLGPKTLCNACGVRYKSGRLVPEYRPAASPTFITSRHSNSHRKVLELRRQNGIVEQHEQQSNSSTANPQLFLPRHPHPHPTNAPNARSAPGGGGGGELWQQMI